MDLTLGEYSLHALDVWASLGLPSGDPPLAAQVAALPKEVFCARRALGCVCWGFVAAELRVTERLLRLAPGGKLERRETIDVMKMEVPVQVRRQGHATRFLKELAACACDMGRVVMVESVLSEDLHRILVRLGCVSQAVGDSLDEKLHFGENYVLVTPK